jgi:copper resistance protein D
MDMALVMWRVIHFAATIAICGVLLFRCVVFDPIEARRGDIARLRFLDHQMRLIFWVSLAFSFVSGVAWLLVVSAEIDDRTWHGALADGAVWSILTDTHFGQAWAIRAIVGVMLGACVAWAPKLRVLQLLLSMLFVGALAFGGHGASSPGAMGDAHLAADILHLIAVSAWLGGLLPYALCLRSLQKEGAQDSLTAVHDATLRFSNVGIAAVLTILATGLVNTINLVGSVELLTNTEYGRLLVVKMLLFAAMVTVATINRLALTPRLSLQGTVDKLRLNIMIETALGLLILCIVAALGTMPPAFIDHAGM